MTYDYVVVGAGSADCVLANRLSEEGRHRVLLLEAGPPDTNPWIHVPIGYGKTMFHPVLNWGFETEPDPKMNGRRVYWPRGRTLGGSSAVNGLIQIRGQPEDFDGWAAQGAEGWDWQGVLPYFRKSAISVEKITQRSELVDAFINAASDLGVARNDDFNGATQEGAGYLHLTTRNARRCSAATAYLQPARSRANLTVETNARVTSVLLEGRRACGVRYRKAGTDVRAQAGREVILAAGALQSPQLLQLSGIGPGALLQRIGIPVVADLPGVGANLQDHLALRFLYRCTKPVTTNDELRNLWR
jgi:choline dehydrogenase